MSDPAFKRIAMPERASGVLSALARQGYQEPEPWLAPMSLCVLATDNLALLAERERLTKERERLREEIEHVLRYGKVGKQSERRLRAALEGAPDA